MEFHLEDVLLAANLTNKLKFQGLSDTTELRDTVNEFFEALDGVNDLIAVFERNTLLTLRRSIIKCYFCLC